jgi:hypothetical protein
VLRSTARASLVLLLLAAAVRSKAATLEFEPFEAPPASVAALAAGAPIEAFAVAPAASAAVCVIARPGEGSVSVLRSARGADAPRDVTLSGTLVGLALVPDGTAAYAIVRVANKKGVVRSIELLRVDLAAARAISVASLPATATGLAVTADGATLLVASKDEIRTFLLPAIASGRVYRALGDNVGVAPLPGSTYALVAQRSQLALVDLAAPQGRDGLELKEAAPSPAPLRGLLAATGASGPIALADGGAFWRVRVGDLPSPPVVIPSEPAAPPPTEPAAPPPAPVATPPKTEAAAQEPPPTPPPPPPAAAVEAREVPGEPGTVSGSLSGPGLAEVAAVVFLGPDNVLREAARVVPDATGRFNASALRPGSYRIVAAGKGGRVLVCRPPYIPIRVGPNSAVEAPVIEVLRAQ